METQLKHRDCDGEINEDWSKTYETEEGTPMPAYRCSKCRMEIVGDNEVEIWISGQRADL